MSKTSDQLIVESVKASEYNDHDVQSQPLHQRSAGDRSSKKRQDKMEARSFKTPKNGSTINGKDDEAHFDSSFNN